ncbi:eRF1 domain 2 [Leptospira sp. 201903070]|jgi:stalled ribosome rescue protein Dom34|uniref:ERF1 domain 2 n=1 Tax=Leptospira ainlahdjerensis TaxID=2810033 RepID=A0ABS2UH81_9LEPT|nr:eRF1 domain 2 [Leptospira ainlahdjerensis]MBM9579726.1 eRF1 domain 2 [Leptospira ainlahdjerensis]
MPHCILWIDQSVAKKFVLSKDTVDAQIIHHKGKPEHHDHHPDRFNLIQNEDLKHFFEDVASKLSPNEDLLISGPGLAKTHFLTFLEKQHPAIAKMVLAEIVMDQSTDPEIIAAAKKYYEKRHIQL